MPDRRDAAGPTRVVASGLPSRLSGLCLFLDVDGTLLDLAETPDAVVVPPGLQADLDGLSSRLGGALALVTGRPLDFVDRLFPGNDFFLAGLHGAEIRAGNSTAGPLLPADDALEAAKARIVQAARNWPGVLVEDKGIAVALHYRQAPAREPLVRALMEEIAASIGPGWTLQAGKFVVELRPAGRDKGDALRTFMELQPFVGRLPLAIGDDVTDEAMFRAANDAGGLSIRVGKRCHASAARGCVGTPAELRDWIAARGQRGNAK